MKPMNREKLMAKVAEIKEKRSHAESQLSSIKALVEEIGIAPTPTKLWDLLDAMREIVSNYKAQ